MIERYALHEIDKLRDQFALAAGVPKGVKRHYNIQPAQSIPVILRRDGANVMEQMQWGFVPQNAKDTNSIFRYKTFVARSEDVFSKPMWEPSIYTQRCIVPVNGFYVWSQAAGTKSAYYVQAKDRSLFALAGIYSKFTTANGTESSMVSIIAVPSNNDTYELTNRLPVVLKQDQEDNWLNPAVGDRTSLFDIMRMAPVDSLTITRVGDGIFSKKADTPELIRPV